MKTLTEQEKTDMENAILKLPCDCITALQGGCIEPMEVLKNLSVQLGIDEKDECAICLSDLQGNLTVLPCHPTHAFHNDCIKKWVNMQGPNLCQCWRKICYLYKKLPCPICRVNFSPSALGLISDYCRLST